MRGHYLCLLGYYRNAALSGRYSARLVSGGIDYNERRLRNTGMFDLAELSTHHAPDVLVYGRLCRFDGGRYQSNAPNADL